MEAAPDAAVAIDMSRGCRGEASSMDLPSELSAILQVVFINVVLSGDNAIVVGMAAGLALSVALMGAAATFIAKLLDRYRWLAWLGLLVILYVAFRMIWDGGWDVGGAMLASGPLGSSLPPG